MKLITVSSRGRFLHSFFTERSGEIAYTLGPKGLCTVRSNPDT